MGWLLYGCVLQCSEGDWDLYWCDVGWMKEYFDHYYMDEHMKLCHFRNHYEALC